MRCAIYAFAMLISCAALTLADRWDFPNELVKEEFTFGQSKFILEIDGTKDTGFPTHTLSIYAGDQLLAKYKNVGFEKVYGSEDNKFFVGISNCGIPGTAFVVFDAEGNLLREQKHRFLPEALYTRLSVTLIREWFDEKDPGVRFDVRGGQLEAVYIRGSNRRQYDLLAADLGFRDATTER